MSTLRQLASYGLIGLGSNSVLYVLYLGITALGVSPQPAMALVFGLGVLCTFTLNRRLTFRHRGAVSQSAARYAAVYLLAYVASAAALALLVDVAGLPHQLVMLGLIVAVAAMLFILQKYWVFAPKPGFSRSL